MLDSFLRPLIDPPLQSAGRLLARTGLTADAVTLLGLAAGLAAAVAIARGSVGVALALIGLSRVLDGLDGAVARVHGATDRGGYLDIVCDFAFYASVPLAFAWLDPARNALPAAALLAAFTLTCASFLAYATLAAKRGMETRAQGEKSFFYSFGLMEGSETIAFFVAMTLWPARFATLAWIFSGLCLITVLQRSMLARVSFR